ncbi:MAG: threonine synthase [Candidatus Eisenbacteria bacterium]
MPNRGATVVRLSCLKCGREYEESEARFTCLDCGTEGILDVEYDYDEARRRLTRESLAASREHSIWRYLPLLPVGSDENLPVLATGWTPLYDVPGLLGLERVLIKDDGRNPTASLKDRATAVAMARAVREGVSAVAAASTGNAGCSLSGFAAAQQMPCYIFVPASAPRPKVAQLLVYGATVFAVDGSYDDAFDLAVTAIEKFGWYNRCCAVNPYLVEGKKTVAFEVAEQMGFSVPDKVFVSVGDGCIASGVTKGFREFAEIGLIDRVPEVVGVQAEGCSPMASAFHASCELVPTEARTCADSIAVGHPRNWRKAVKGIRASGGTMMTVTDDEIIAAIPALARSTGVFGEPAGVTAFAGLTKAAREGGVSPDETVVVLMTGSGLKDTESAMRSAGEPVAIGRSISDVEAALAAAGRA